MQISYRKAKGPIWKLNPRDPHSCSEETNPNPYQPTDPQQMETLVALAMKYLYLKYELGTFICAIMCSVS